MLDHYKRKHGDRYDGWRIKNCDPFFFLIPVIMRTRLDSQCFFEEECDLDSLMDFIHRYKQEIPGLSIMDIMIASAVRTISQKPHTNRFIAGNKLYARNQIVCSLVMKREMSAEGQEAIIKVEFQPEDTLQDVVRKINAEIEATSGEENDTDKTAQLLSGMPTWILRFFVSFLRGLDRVGWLPKALHKVSPWHSSFFVTNVASLRIRSIYHHLYEFGTCSCFIALGRPEKKNELTVDGKVATRRMMSIKYNADERICDGFYYADAFKLSMSYLKNPEKLLVPPEKVIKDDGVKR